MSKAPANPPVGIKEIAERLGVKRQTVALWHMRGQLPDHEFIVSGQPCWMWRTIERWARATGRIEG